MSLEQRLARALRQQVSDLRNAFGDARSRLWGASPAKLVRQGAARCGELALRLKGAQLALLQQGRERLLPLIRTLQAVSPLATLNRGYAIVNIPGGAILRQAREAPKGTLIEARLLGKGTIVARVGRIEELRHPWLALMLLIPCMALCAALPRESAVPGGVKLIDLGVAGSAVPDVQADGHRALVVTVSGHWIAVIGIPLAAGPGCARCRCSSPAARGTLNSRSMTSVT